MVEYEWKVEELDEIDDIVNVCSFDTLKECWSYSSGMKRFQICLARDVWDNVDDNLLDRSFAYLTEDGLPEVFEGNRLRVPKRFHNEVFAD